MYGGFRRGGGPRSLKMQKKMVAARRVTEGLRLPGGYRAHPIQKTQRSFKYAVRKPVPATAKYYMGGDVVKSGKTGLFHASGFYHKMTTRTLPSIHNVSFGAHKTAKQAIRATARGLIRVHAHLARGVHGKIHQVKAHTRQPKRSY